MSLLLTIIGKLFAFCINGDRFRFNRQFCRLSLRCKILAVCTDLSIFEVSKVNRIFADIFTCSIGSEPKTRFYTAPLTFAVFNPA